MEQSIIEIIQDMVQKGEPEQRIIQTLKDLGVKENQAKKLLLVAEADTFNLLRTEIRKLINEAFAEKEQEFLQVIRNDIASVEQGERNTLQEIAYQELEEVKGAIIAEAKEFEQRVNKTLGNSDRAIQLVKSNLDAVHSRIGQLELDVEQMKVRRFRKSSGAFSVATLIAGIAVIGFDLFLAASYFKAIDIAQIILLIIIALFGITLVFASIIS